MAEHLCKPCFSLYTRVPQRGIVNTPATQYLPSCVAAYIPACGYGSLEESGYGLNEVSPSCVAAYIPASPKGGKRVWLEERAESPKGKSCKGK
jgi:hypothetical protein